MMRARKRLGPSFATALLTLLLGACTAGEGAAPAAVAAPCPPTVAPTSTAAPAAPAAGSPTITVSLQAPLFAEAFETAPVARIGDEVVLLQELNLALAATHAKRTTDSAEKAIDFKAILDRIIDVRLAVLEARQMGLDELPEAQESLTQYRRTLLQAELERTVTVSVKPDPDEVERIYKDKARQWKLQSLWFAKTEDASEALSQLQAAEPFAEVATRAVSTKKAKGGSATNCMRLNDLHPAIAAAVKGLEALGLAPVTAVADGFAVIQLVEICYPDNPALLAQAEQQSIDRQSTELLRKYFEDLVKKHAVIDDKRLKNLDLEAAKPGFAALLKDARVLAKIAGGESITVADLAAQIEKKLFHGTEAGVKERRVNVKKHSTFESMVRTAVGRREAELLSLANTDRYRRKVAEHERSLVFDLFLRRAVIPEIAVSAERVREYYEQHKSEYMLPEFVKLSTLGFRTLAAAEDAIAKLRAGTDVRWLRANAAERVSEEQQAEELTSATVTTKSLSGGLAAALTGAQAGDYRLYDNLAGVYYVVIVEGRIAAKATELEEIQEALRKKVFAEQLEVALADWGKKLRAAYPVEIYLTRIGS
ncbi:MAG: peptidyl-prolyl cis-trans isomerase [Deltaproteobacteria bacterium]|nr:peptidyl-prolyl cis-trans isomerase [Deltaproteobacteria bacterium]